MREVGLVRDGRCGRRDGLPRHAPCGEAEDDWGGMSERAGSLLYVTGWKPVLRFSGARSKAEGLVKLPALRAAGAVHVGVVRVHEAAAGAAKDLVVRGLGLEAPPPPFAEPNQRRQRAQQERDIGEEQGRSSHGRRLGQGRLPFNAGLPWRPARAGGCCPNPKAENREPKQTRSPKSENRNPNAARMGNSHFALRPPTLSWPGA